MHLGLSIPELDLVIIRDSYMLADRHFIILSEFLGGTCEGALFRLRLNKSGENPFPKFAPETNQNIPIE